MEERRKAAWIGGSVLVKGDVVASEDLVIDGQVQGKIELGDHSLTIGSGAVIVASLTARSVIIAGKVQGDVAGASGVHLKSTATLDGDVTAPKFSMEDGATFMGKVGAGKA